MADWFLKFLLPLFVCRYFDEAANNLNLSSLIAFLRELRASSRHQLYQNTTKQVNYCLKVSKYSCLCDVIVLKATATL